MKFDWEEFMNKNNRIAVHCKTEEEAIDFCKQMHEHGMKWVGGESYLKNNNWDEYYEEDTCYTNIGQFSSKDFYEKYNYIILEWSDYMIKDPIDYLEYGYVVECENGEFAMYMPIQNGKGFDFGEQNGSLLLDNFNNNLQYMIGNFDKYDIKKIYGYAKWCYMTMSLDVTNRPLIWERPKEEVKKMTVAEICKELGYKVEIVEG